MKTFISLLIVVSAMLANTNVHAQESSREWKSPAVVGTFNTQKEVEAAIHGIGEPFNAFIHILDSKITEDSVIYNYWMGVNAPTVPAWQYNVGSEGPYYESEQDTIEALIETLNRQSTADGCPAVSTAVPIGEWEIHTTWVNGQSNLESRDAHITTVQKQGGDDCHQIIGTELYWRQREIHCAEPNVGWSSDYQACAMPELTVEVSSGPLLCDPCSLVGNPSDVTTGSKFESEVDFDLGWIGLTRYYHSGTNNASNGFGYGWAHSHNMRLTLGIDNSTGETLVGLVKENGTQLPFRKQGAEYEAVDGSGDRVVNDGQWRLRRSDVVATFNEKGFLIQNRYQDGTTLDYVYADEHLLSKITHSSGRSIEFIYTSPVAGAQAQIETITTNGIVVSAYVYKPDGQLESVTYPGLPTPGTRAYHYEDPRFPFNLTGITAEDERRYSTFTYDEKARVKTSEHAGGADRVSLRYTPEGGAIVTDALENETNYALTPGGPNTKYRKVTSTSDDRGAVGRTFYDQSVDFRRRLDTFTDLKGVHTKHEYSEAFDAIAGAQVSIHKTTEAVGQPEQRIREEHRVIATNQLVLVKADMQQIRYRRNARNQPLTVTVTDTNSGLSRTQTFSYCEQADVTAGTCPRIGLVKSINGPRTDANDVTAFTYYSSDDPSCASAPATCPHRKGDLWKVTNALGYITETLKYDSAGRVLAVKDANGVVTDIEYHPRGWLTARKVRGADPTVETDDKITRIDYWPTGLVKRVTQPGGAFTSYIHDAAYRLTDIADGSGNTIHYDLDNKGNRKQEDTKDAQGALKRTLSRVYNQLGQLETMKTAAQHATGFDYDFNGNVETITDALTRVTDNDYDPLNRLKRTLQDVDGIEAETIFDYDALDRLIKVTDPKDLDTEYKYNAFGDLTKLTSRDTGVTDYTYDSAGNRQTQVDARGIVTTYTYDALNRLKTIAYSDGSPGTLFNYDSPGQSACPYVGGESLFMRGRLAKMIDAGGMTQYCYDRFGHMVGKRISSGAVLDVRYGYDVAGRLMTITYPGKLIIDYVRDSQARTTEVGVKPVNGVRQVLLHQITYHPFGPVASWTYGNGRTMQRPLDQDYQPLAISDPSPGGLSLGYEFNPVGNLVNLRNADQSTRLARYDYDALNRLTDVMDGPNGNVIEHYAYDATGNRTSLTTNAGTTPYAYPATSHHLDSVGNIARSYDTAGNTTAIGGTAKEFVYGGNNRMAQVKHNGVTAMSYLYNGKGEQVRRTAGATSAHTVYDEAGHWLGDYNNSATALQTAIWLDDLPIGLIANNQLHYVEPDHLGTPRVVIDPVRNVAVWKWDMTGEAFGDTLPNQDPDADGSAFVFDMRYPGQRYDAASGLSQNGFRDYEAVTGRYSQSDLIGLRGGISTYAYVGGNPINWIDPYGLTAVPIPAPYFPPWLGSIGRILGAGPGGPLTLLLWPSEMGAGTCPGGPGTCGQMAQAKDGSESKPDNCPTGTLPIDKAKGKFGFGKDGLHGIKTGVGAGPRTWTGIAPNGDVWTGGPGGTGTNHGPYGPYLPGGG